ncbi:HlyD family type I secretion periplasmic adaptor subunit [Arenibaculum pallidiluteum]|uniref:HlyD family type I secretion periplasmic adaptor subunit n=1 Tax=Arenibaculum pallidiluteum TaxID=2812559 RepID=UPI001A969231|nr:HlyD family type I secretion periplasmic adaptor subunit [Arenibaculum pallidiluteum]
MTKQAVQTWHVTLDAEPPEPTLRRTALWGTVAVVIGFGGFLGWSLTAELDSAAIAQGTLMVDSHRKTISHLEGGILRELLVREGDVVAPGQPLLRLDATQSGAIVAQLQSQYWMALARAARLRAEQADSRGIAFPDEILQAAEATPVAREAMDAERQLLETRRRTLEGQVAVQQRRIVQLKEEIVALGTQRVATRDRLRYTEDELRVVKSLLDKGYERKPRLLELQRAAAELQGRLGEIAGEQSQAEQGIATAELEILNLRSARATEVADELQRSQTTAADLAERLRGAADILRRNEITAPQGGRVTNIRFFTPGGAIPQGAPILDLVPQDDELVVTARVMPQDIDVVHVGQSASVRLTAYKQRRVPPIDGTVLAVSADQLEDPRSGNAYFEARIRLSAEAVAGAHGVELYPGMPAEVMIRGPARLAIDYFTAPIAESMGRAFREE